MTTARPWMSWLICGLLASLHVGTDCAVAAESVVRRAEVRRTDDGYAAEFVFWVPAPPEAAFAVMVDFERMPGWVPGLREARVLRREAGRATVEYRGVVRYGVLAVPFTTRREVSFSPPDWIRTAQVAGTMKEHRSRMDFVAEGAGTRIDYRVQTVPNGLAARVMSEGRVASELTEHCRAIAAEVARRTAVPADAPR